MIRQRIEVNIIETRHYQVRTLDFGQLGLDAQLFVISPVAAKILVINPDKLFMGPICQQYFFMDNMPVVIRSISYTLLAGVAGEQKPRAGAVKEKVFAQMFIHPFKAVTTMRGFEIHSAPGETLFRQYKLSELLETKVFGKATGVQFVS